MNFEETIEALKHNTLEIDCSDMTLTQSVGGNPISYQGKGYIRQDADGSLKFKMFVSEVENTNMADNLNALLGTKSGRLYSDADFYNLSARALDNKVWKAERILPHPRWTFGNCRLVHGDLRSIKCETTLRDSQYFVSLHFFDNVPTPCFPPQGTGGSEVRRAQFPAAGAEFTVAQSADEIVLTADSKEPLKDVFHTRMDEALKFLTAKPIQWRALARQNEQNHCVELVSGFRRSANTRLDPPISSSIEGYWEYGWKLYAAYLEYSLKATKHPHWNHCTYHLHNACEASANSLDAWAIGLSVAVEGIASMIPTNDLSEPEKEKLTELKAAVFELVRSNNKFSQFEKRLGGLLGMLTHERVQDRMGPLIASGNISSTYVDAWKKLRDRQVHPKEVDPQKMDAGDYQNLIDRINKTTVFMYEIIFYLIGYQGPHADYGTHGYPTRQYPLPVPTTRTDPF